MLTTLRFLPRRRCSILVFSEDTHDNPPHAVLLPIPLKFTSTTQPGPDRVLAPSRLFVRPPRRPAAAPSASVSVSVVTRAAPAMLLPSLHATRCASSHQHSNTAAPSQQCAPPPAPPPPAPPPPGFISPLYISLLSLSLLALWLRPSSSSLGCLTCVRGDGCRRWLFPLGSRGEDGWGFVHGRRNFRGTEKSVGGASLQRGDLEKQEAAGLLK